MHTASAAVSSTAEAKAWLCRALRAKHFSKTDQHPPPTGSLFVATRAFGRARDPNRRARGGAVITDVVVTVAVGRRKLAVEKPCPHRVVGVPVVKVIIPSWAVDGVDVTAGLDLVPGVRISIPVPCYTRPLALAAVRRVRPGSRPRAVWTEVRTG